MPWNNLDGTGAHSLLPPWFADLETFPPQFFSFVGFYGAPMEHWDPRGDGWVNWKKTTIKKAWKYFFRTDIAMN
jgi:hypothetical protein